MFKSAALIAALGAVSFSTTAFAGDTTTAMSDGMAQKGDMAMMMEGDAPMIHDAYARASSPNARSGAAFMVIMNPTDQDDTLIEVRADVSARVELHTHIKGDGGVMMMREVEGGFPIPAGGTYTLQRGGDHVMFMGITESFEQGMEIPVTFVFEKAGEIDGVVPVDLERQDMMGGHGGDNAGRSHGEALSN